LGTLSEPGSYISVRGNVHRIS